jgi:hypothetical protein
LTQTELKSKMSNVPTTFTNNSHPNYIPPQPQSSTSYIYQQQQQQPQSNEGIINNDLYITSQNTMIQNSKQI